MLVQQLTDDEYQLRTSYLYHPQQALIQSSSSVGQSAEEEMEYQLRNLLNFYARKWNIHPHILIVNLHRLFAIISQLTLKTFVEQRQKNLYQLSIKEWFIALEFYLQMDLERFCLKTVSTSSNSINSRMRQTNLFCHQSMLVQYGMKQCRDRTCRFCYERLDLTQRFERAIHFSSEQIHSCLNGYTIYLNCIVTCTTSNVLYALTCPCHQYDYIGQYPGPIRDRIWQHRTIGCRLMSNFFLGSIVADRLQAEREANPLDQHPHRKLYQHSLECPVALNMFLTCHSLYWCLVPMSKEQASIDDSHISAAERELLQYYQQYGILPQEDIVPSQYHRSMTLVKWCLEHLPVPQTNYQFSQRQQLEQIFFFRDRIDLYPSRFLDLYNATILIALPENSSDELRHLLHALLIAHTAPKLNITTEDDLQIDLFRMENISASHSSRTRSWYQSLIHPRLHLFIDY